MFSLAASILTSLGNDFLLAATQHVTWRDVTDGAGQPYHVVVVDVSLDGIRSQLLVSEVCATDAFALYGLVPSLDLAVGQGIEP